MRTPLQHAERKARIRARSTVAALREEERCIHRILAFTSGSRPPLSLPLSLAKRPPARLFLSAGAFMYTYASYTYWNSTKLYGAAASFIFPLLISTLAFDWITLAGAAPAYYAHARPTKCRYTCITRAAAAARARAAGRECISRLFFFCLWFAVARARERHGSLFMRPPALSCLFEYRGSALRASPLPKWEIRERGWEAGAPARFCNFLIDVWFDRVPLFRPYPCTHRALERGATFVFAVCRAEKLKTVWNVGIYPLLKKTI